MFTIRYNRTTNHLEGLAVRTPDRELDYSLSACGALSRNLVRMAKGKQFETVAEALAGVQASARATGRRVCANCEAAAQAMIEK